MLFALTAVVSAAAIAVPVVDVVQFGEVTCTRSPTKQSKTAIQQKHAFTLIRHFGEYRSRHSNLQCPSEISDIEQKKYPELTKGDLRKIQCVENTYAYDGVEAALGYYGRADDGTQVSYVDLYAAAKRMENCLSVDVGKLETWVEATVWTSVKEHPGLIRTFWMGRSIYE